MHMAQDLLSTTELTIGAIARRVGYGAEEAFSRAFTRAYGESPMPGGLDELAPWPYLCGRQLAHVDDATDRLVEEDGIGAEGGRAEGRTLARRWREDEREGHLRPDNRARVVQIARAASRDEVAATELEPLVEPVEYAAGAREISMAVADAIAFGFLARGRVLCPGDIALADVAAGVAICPLRSGRCPITPARGALRRGVRGACRLRTRPADCLVPHLVCGSRACARDPESHGQEGRGARCGKALRSDHVDSLVWSLPCGG